MNDKQTVATLDDQRIDAIERRCDRLLNSNINVAWNDHIELLEADVPALISAVREIKSIIGTSAYAYSNDASNVCERIRAVFNG